MIELLTYLDIDQDDDCSSDVPSDLLPSVSHETSRRDGFIYLLYQELRLPARWKTRTVNGVGKVVATNLI